MKSQHIDKISPAATFEPATLESLGRIHEVAAQVGTISDLVGDLGLPI